MGRSEEYRSLARRCLEMARSTADAQTKAAVLQMAQASLRLADKIETSDQRPQQRATTNGDAEDKL